MKLNYKQLNQKDFLQTIKSERLSSLEAAEKVDQNKKKVREEQHCAIMLIEKMKH